MYILDQVGEADPGLQSVPGDGGVAGDPVEQVDQPHPGPHQAEILPAELSGQTDPQQVGGAAAGQLSPSPGVSQHSCSLPA